MNSIKAWAAAVCSASIALAVLEGLLPEKSTARAAKLAAALWLVLIVISPLVGLKVGADDISIEFQEAYDPWAAQSADELVLSEASRNIEKELYEVLSREGVEPLDIEASVNISEVTGIYCDRVCVTLAEKDAASLALVSCSVLEAVGREPEIKEMMNEKAG